MDEFWERTRSQYTFVIERDSRYLNWRCSDCPTPYQMWIGRCGKHITGYAAVFVNRVERLGHIVDLFTNPEDAPTSAALLRTSAESVLAQGALAIHT